jgi:4-amino-4-deoxy-L-arabinose transferase-like glycosyltransferase
MQAVARSALALDPGKPVLYHVILHWFCGWFGLGETALRFPSVVFGVLSSYLVLALGADLFGFEAGFTAAVLWTFNPLAAVLARWARMYSLLVAATLGHLLALEKVRRGAGRAMVWLAGLLGGAMLYVHLGGMLILAADVAVILREIRHGNSRSWPPVAIALVLFLPFLPLMIAQSRALLFGHWLDWLGAKPAPSVSMILLLLIATATTWWLVLGCRDAGERRERLQQCLLYGLLPVLLLLICTVLIRPALEIRYVSPSMAVLTIVAACLLDRAGARVRNLATLALGGFFLSLLPLCYSAPRDPWPRIAAQVAAAATAQEPIFFESGFFAVGRVIDGAGEGGFPSGFFRIPFDYYFHQGNPRAVIPGGQSAAAQRIIEAAATRAGGAWLISAKNLPEAARELPCDPLLQVDYVGQFARISVFHIKAMPVP